MGLRTVAGMRIVLQRVSAASVDVADAATGERDASFEPRSIGEGYVLLVGVGDEDGDEQVAWLARKIANLRVFEDENGKMNRSIHDVGGEVLSISQFTLFGDVRKGNRPSFIAAGKPEHAEKVWRRFGDALRAEGLTVKEGRFGAHMRVSLTNDGPVTIVMDTDQLMRKA
ncbi:D-tyrosyl-tRNA(Tyr) deacylase [Bifidobacterium lemurum]|uniref:D-aminoacyl-tRNA deacylase n=2 Tax=Bifidobacterium lemurum TaxID=1603886 RepID=A0A261FMI9_9BIFI|nr:D-tyrosyl-tRNA(Tyr) deacylase [Bifidobacterium lemurum]